MCSLNKRCENRRLLIGLNHQGLGFHQLFQARRELSQILVPQNDGSQQSDPTTHLASAQRFLPRAVRGYSRKEKLENHLRDVTSAQPEPERERVSHRRL